MKKILIILFLNCFVSISFGQTEPEEYLSKIDDICYCEIGKLHPSQIVSLDNNWEILVNLKNGKTLEELSKSNVKYTLSQIQLLLIGNLIKRKDNSFYTNIPILSEEETLTIRKETKKIAEDITSLIQEDLQELKKSLELKQNINNEYSILFSFVLDGLVWDILEEKNIIQKREVNKNKPFWNGVYWVVEPKRKFSCGTNSLTLKNVSINENWSDNSTISVSNYNMLEKLLEDYIVNGKITKKEVLKTFDKNRLFDKKGQLIIPIIKKIETDIIYLQSINVADKIVEYLKNRIDYNDYLKSYKNLEKDKKIIILYHEIMWDILTVLEERKLIVKPIAFRQPEKTKNEDLKDLLFIVEE